MNNYDLPVVLLMGATATGKTDLAVELVERHGMEIISVDSALIYRDMDIGTAKPDAALLQRAPHRLIDILDPKENWSAWSFVQAALQLINDIHARGKIPLLVGGTMMYFNALQQGLNDLPMADDTVREQLNLRLQDQGLQALYDELQSIDPQWAEKLKPTDTQRILRGLEVFRISGQPLSELTQSKSAAPALNFKQVILDVPERSVLHERIALRFHLMLKHGFEQEVVALRERGDLDLSMPSMRCVGYRQMWQFLDGEFGHADMVDKGIAATRQLAKRQLTWLRKYTSASRFDFSHVNAESVSAALQLG